MSNERELSDDVLDLVQDIIFAMGEEVYSASDIDEVMPRFVMGLSSDEEEVAVLRACCENPLSRKKLVQLQRELHASGTDLASQKAFFSRYPAWQATVTKAFEQTLGMMHHWDRVFRDVTSPPDGITSNLLRAVGRTLVHRTGGHAATATRAAAVKGEIRLYPERIPIHFEGTISEYETMEAEIRLPESVPDGTFTLFAGNHADGSWIDLGSATSDQGHLQLSLAGFKHLMEADDLFVDRHWFILSSSEGAFKIEALPLRIFQGAEVRTLFVTVSEQPSIRSGVLRFSFIAPPLIAELTRKPTIRLTITLGSMAYILWEKLVEPESGGTVTIEVPLGTEAEEGDLRTFSGFELNLFA